ncbi:Glycosyltransferase involved in cell wall bisynthesis [Aquimarina amphilecti]|uniref:Glycosyltransferase involved in cell wall bisynthesis n=1 Tax=Aquimarina amphilecti TaxID=1038014 RepID=A0A1H7WB53_AQUAM|nr:glycosyltransferase family A protein [Aquimarina amphilecti]SEM18710.1 Glycosyltransferase involved in cell wall bisynthesis [Aquimarina amphilecti]
MLSILIPVYNYNIIPLVREVHQQISLCNVPFEILVFDDHSDHHINENKSINDFSHSSFKRLPKNIGRSAIRNLLASEASYDFLLFIDAGTFPEQKNFIKIYLDNLNHKVVTGGMTYLKQPPNKPYRLRWVYTKKRESLSDRNKRSIVCSSNFLIQKKLFKIVEFDESLEKYGCEDVVFFDAIVNENISIKHIDNSVIHDANDNAETFIIKTEQAIENLIFLINTNKLAYDRYKVSKLYYKMNKVKIDKIISFTFKISRNILKRNFNSSYPSILCYDFYRLGYFCLIKNKA